MSVPFEFLYGKEPIKPKLGFVSRLIKFFAAKSKQANHQRDQDAEFTIVESLGHSLLEAKPKVSPNLAKKHEQKLKSEWRKSDKAHKRKPGSDNHAFLQEEKFSPCPVTTLHYGQKQPEEAWLTKRKSEAGPDLDAPTRQRVFKTQEY